MVTLTAAIVMLVLVPDVSSAQTGTSRQSHTHRRVAVSVLALGAGYANRGGSDQVRTIQRRLRRLGYRPVRVDGFYGPRTEAAVRGFQSQHKLSADGVAGPATVGQLHRHVAASRKPGLRRGIGVNRFAGPAAVRKVQRRLRSLGFHAGPVDGVFGFRTARAVEAFQRTEALEVDGIVGSRTRARLRRPFMTGPWPAGPVWRGVGYWRPGGSIRVRELQRRMRQLWLRPGSVDGLFGPRTEAAVRRFQRRHGLVVDGIVGPKTLGAMRNQPAGARPIVDKPRHPKPQHTKPSAQTTVATSPARATDVLTWRGESALSSR